MNRAVHQDVVAIEMLPESEWSCPSSMVMEDEEEKADEDAGKEVCNNDTFYYHRYLCII